LEVETVKEAPTEAVRESEPLEAERVPAVVMLPELRRLRLEPVEELKVTAPVFWR